MTWPPRATVRQLSIADITFNWPRLTWPALACRQAGPWSRKISAISRAGRAMIAVAYDGGFFSDVSGVSRSNGLMTADHPRRARASLSAFDVAAAEHT